MSVEGWMLVATAVLAVVAVCAAIISVRAVRQLSRSHPAQPVEPASPRTSTEVVVRSQVPTVLPPDLEPRVVEGRLVVPPTQDQVLQATLGRPGVRLSVVVHGAAHALRAESRDRIAALMRREYRRRRRERLQAGRRAVRAAQPTQPGDQWLGS